MLEKFTSKYINKYAVIQKRYEIRYNNFWEFLYFLKYTGSIKRLENKGLKSGVILKNIGDYYVDNYEKDSQIYSSWEILFVHLSVKKNV